MKLRQLSLAVLFLCLAALTVRADGIPDSSLKVGHGSDPGKSDFCASLHFPIALNGSGGGIENCINTSGVDWIGLTITAIVSTVNNTATCADFTDFIFTSCSSVMTPIGKSGNDRIVITLEGGGVITTGSAGTVCPTFPDPSPQSCFFLNFNNGGTTGSKDLGGWFGLNDSKGGTVMVNAIPTAEPGTICLMAAGLGILGGRRRAKSSR